MSNTNTFASPHQELMWNLFCSTHLESIHQNRYLNRAIELLNSNTVDIHDQDNQLFREIYSGRFHYDILVNTLTTVIGKPFRLPNYGNENYEQWYNSFFD